MWYRFDPFRFAQELLPPLLRSDVLLAILRAMLRPLGSLLERFDAYRESVRIRLSTTGQTFSLEGALAEKYQLPSGVIYITDSGDKRLFLYTQLERHAPWHLRKTDEVDEAVFLSYASEGKYEPDFIVHIPSFLRNEKAEIKRFIARYKPAGRSYQITFYAYE